MNALHARRQGFRCGGQIGNAASQAQERLFGECRLIQRLILNGAVEAQVAFFGEP
ncbi:hypothetical protein D3C77_652360 [compost metagenome]